MSDIDSLSIQITADTSGAETSIDRLVGKLNALNAAVKGASNYQKLTTAIKEISAAVKGMDKDTETKLSSFARGLDALSKVGSLAKLKNVAGYISDISAAINGVSSDAEERLQGLARGLSALSEAQRGRTGGVTNASDSGTAPITPRPDSFDTETMADDADSATESTDRLDDALRRTANNANGISSVAHAIAQITGASGLASDALGLMGSRFAEIGSFIGRYGLMSLPRFFGGQLVENIKKSTQSLGSFLKSIKRIATYRLIRTALKLITQGINEGIKNLYEWSNTADHTFANSMNRIATASQYLGNSFAAMASPLIDFVSPAIDFIIDKFVAMFNIISQIIARLTGRTSYTAAKKVAAQWSDASKKAGGSAKDAAEEIKRTILGFDEINKLNAPNESGGGGGGGGAGGGAGSSMFETLPIDSEISNFADQLKAAFLEGDWQELGTLLGEKVNELVDSIDFAGAGQKVGYYINAWFSTKYWTLDTINFTNIGSKIAEFLNNAINEINFEIIGRLLVQKMTIIGDLAIGFFTDFDWGQAAGKLSDFVEGLFDELSDWLEKYDWTEIGRTVAYKLQDALSNVKFEDVAQSVMRALANALKAAASLTQGILSGVWETLAEYWETNIKADTFMGTAANLLKAIGNAFVQLATGQWVWENMIQPFIGALVGNEHWDTDLLSVGENIINGIYEGIKNAFANVGNWIKTNIFDPFLKWLKSVFGIASPAKTMIEPGENIMNGVLQGILNVMSTIGQWITDNVFKGIESAFTLAESVVQSLAAIGETIINTVLGGILGVMGGIASWVASNIIAPLLDAFTKSDEEEQGDDFSSKLWEAIKGKWTSSNRQLTVKLTANKTASDIWDSLVSDWNRIQNKALEIGIAVTDAASDVWEAFKSAWDAAGSKGLYFSAKLDNTADVLYSTFKSEWDASGSKTLYFTPALDNTGTVLYSNFKKQWDDSGSKTLYFSPQFDNNAAAMYTLFKSAWDAAGSKLLYFSPKFDNSAGALYDAFKAEWDAAGSKVLYFSPMFDNNAETLYSAFISTWENAGSKALYFSAKLDNAADVLYNSFKSAWDASGSKILYFSPKMDNTAKALYDAFKSAWNGIGSLSLYMSPKLDNTAAALWNAFKSAWNSVAETLKVSVELDYGGAIGGGGSTSGGGAGRQVSLDVKLNPPSQEAVSIIGYDVETKWDKYFSIVGHALQLAVTGPSADTIIDISDDIERIFGKNPIGIIMEPVDALGNKLTSLVGNLGKWLFGGGTPQVVVDAYGNMMFVPQSGNGLKVSGSGDNTSFSLNNVNDAKVTVDAAEGTIPDNVKSIFAVAGKTLTTSVNTIVQKGSTWVKEAFEATQLGDKTVQRDVKQSVQQNSWDSAAYSASKLGNDTVDRTLKQSVKMSVWDTIVATIALMTGGTVERTLKQKVQQNGWDASAYNAARISGGTVERTLKQKVQQNGWDASAYNAARISGDTVYKTIKVKCEKDKWSDSAYNVIRAQSRTITITVKMNVVRKTATMTATKSGSNTMKFELKRLGGIFTNGIWRNIAQYANGTTNAQHGSMFIAGENGPEMVGHVGGRTEVLNKSQLASTMFAAVHNAMQGVKLEGNFYNADVDENEFDYESMYSAMYEAFSAALAKSNELDKEKVSLLRQINDKEFTADVTTDSINRAQLRRNRRGGETIVPVG